MVVVAVAAATAAEASSDMMGHSLNVVVVDPSSVDALTGSDAHDIDVQLRLDLHIIIN